MPFEAIESIETLEPICDLIMIIILRLLAHLPGCAICMSWAVESFKPVGLLEAVVPLELIF